MSENQGYNLICALPFIDCVLKSNVAFRIAVASLLGSPNQTQALPEVRLLKKTPQPVRHVLPEKAVYHHLLVDHVQIVLPECRHQLLEHATSTRILKLTVVLICVGSLDVETAACL